MTQRLDTKGHQPIVEYRPDLQLYFILYESLGVELATAFRHKATAQEIAVNAFYGVPFFTMIPTVPIGTVYPRPNTITPRLGPVDIPLRIA